MSIGKNADFNVKNAAGIGFGDSAGCFFQIFCDQRNLFRRYVRDDFELFFGVARDNPCGNGGGKPF